MFLVDPQRIFIEGPSRNAKEFPAQRKMFKKNPKTPLHLYLATFSFLEAFFDILKLFVWSPGSVLESVVWPKYSWLTTDFPSRVLEVSFKTLRCSSRTFKDTSSSFKENRLGLDQGFQLLTYKKFSTSPLEVVLIWNDTSVVFIPRLL